MDFILLQLDVCPNLGGHCPTQTDVKLPISSTVKYCYTVQNTGDYTISSHSLADSQLGAIFTDLSQDLGPGQSYSTVDVPLTITETLFVTTTNVATWTGTLAEPVVDVGALDVVQTTASAAATVRISGDDDDQDNDGIPDNVEGTGDADGDGIPDFLDPDPTNLDESEQPQQSNERLYLPSIKRDTD